MKERDNLCLNYNLQRRCKHPKATAQVSYWQFAIGTKNTKASVCIHAHNYNFECDWLIELCDNKLSNNKLSNNKLSDNNLASALVERTLRSFFLNQSQSRKLYFLWLLVLLLALLLLLLLLLSNNIFFLRNKQINEWISREHLNR